ncbi:acyl-CoA thioesterase [candidate division GN15 bacterium]|nr:acyl-CoA thioesterase [candidate division GN15 bacterium]
MTDREERQESQGSQESSRTYNHRTTVSLYDTDGAGLLFFGNHFRLHEDAYEAFLEEHWLSVGQVLREGRWLIPLVHAEADYNFPLTVGDRLVIRMSCETLSEHSFVLVSVFYKDGTAEAARVRTVHVLVDRQSGDKAPLPDNLRTALAGIQTEA